MVNTDITNSGQYKMTLNNKDSSLDMVNNINGKFTNIQSILSSLQTEIDRSISSTSQSQSSINTMMTKLTNLNNRIKNINNKLNSNSGGKRISRFVIGTSTAGWTSDDCDYLCNGSNDNTIFSNAINALPSYGGEILILDGTYNNINMSISLNANKHIKISGTKGTVITNTSGICITIDNYDAKDASIEISYLTLKNCMDGIIISDECTLNYDLSNPINTYINLHDINLYDIQRRGISVEVGCVNLNRINWVSNKNYVTTGRYQVFEIDNSSNVSLLCLMHNCTLNSHLISSDMDRTSLSIGGTDDKSLTIISNNNVLGHGLYVLDFAANNVICANNEFNAQTYSGKKSTAMDILLRNNNIIINNLAENYLPIDSGTSSDWTTLRIKDGTNSNYNIVALNAAIGRQILEEYTHNTDYVIDFNERYS